jgi:hypothetical protein
MSLHTQILKCYGWVVSSISRGAQADRPFMLSANTDISVFKSVNSVPPSILDPCESKRKKWKLNRMFLENFTAAQLKMTVFWVAAPCSLVEIDRRFRGAYCLYHQGDEWLSSSSKRIKFITVFTKLHPKWLVSQFSPLHTFTPYFSIVHLILSSPFDTNLPNVLLPFRTIY